jgi:O-antigen/teichoic acid export membrane protein
LRPDAEHVPTPPPPLPDNEARVGGRTLIGGLWTSGSQISPYAYTVVVSVVAGRILGPSGLGRQSFIAFVVLAATTVCAAGLPLALVRTSAEALGRGSAGSVRGLAAWGWKVAGVGALFGTGALTATAVFGATPPAAWLFGAVAAAAGILSRVPGPILLGTQHWRENSLVILVCGGGGTVATIVALALGGGITGMLAAAAGTAVAMLLWSFALMNRVLAPMRAEDATALPDLRRKASRFALAASVSVVLTFIVAQRSELFFLDRNSSNAQIAFYTVAFSAVTMLQTLPLGMTNVISPMFARFFGAGQIERIRSGYSRALRLLILLAIPVTAGGIVLGPPLISLAYGDRYSQAGTILRILIASVPLAPLGAVSAALLVGYGRMRFPIVVSAIAAVADVTAAALLVPRLDAIGAAIANEIAAVSATSIQLVYCIRLLGGIEVAPRQFARMVIASAGAAAVAQGALEVGSGALPLLLALAAGVGVLATLAVWLRVLPREDADWLTSALRDTRAHRLGRVCRLLSGGPAPAVR